jgi:hypothetical protein
MRSLSLLCLASIPAVLAGVGLEQKKSFSIAGLKTNMLLRGSSEKDKVALDELRLKGDLFVDDENEVKVSYEVSRDMAADVSKAKVSGSFKGNEVVVEKTGEGYDLEISPQEYQGQAVTATYKGGVWDYKLALGVPSGVLGKVKDALGGKMEVGIKPKLNLASKTGSCAITVDALKAELDYDLNGNKLGYLASYSSDTPLGALKATLKPQAKAVAVEIVDSTIEEGAKWKANFEVPIDSNPTSLTADDLKLSVKRTVSW